jgi:CBS domain-containing protein
MPSKPMNLCRLVEDVMVQQVLTVTENTPIEEAARIISDYDVKILAGRSR